MPIDNPSLSDAVVAVFFSLAIASLIVSVAMKVVLIVYRRKRELRRSSPWIGFFMLLGVDLVLVSLIFSGFTYTTWTCFSITWNLVIGCGLIIGGMLAKSWRIYRIFTNTRAQAISVSDAQMFAVIGGVMVIEVCLLAVYSFPSGLLGPEVVQSSSDIYYRYRTCVVPSPGYQLAMTITFYSVNGLLVLALALLSFATRKIDANYSEARVTTITIYAIITQLLIFLPLIYLSTNSTDCAQVKYAVTAIIEILASWCLMGLLFLPKIWRITFEHSHET